MKKKMVNKMIAIILFVCLFVTIFFNTSNVIYAEEPLKDITEISFSDVLAGIVSPYDYYGMLDASTVPEAVGYETALERTHIERLYNEEGNNLCNVIFKNADGTKTEYIFPYPVKYVANTGEIKDITLEIEDSTVNQVAYATADNNVVTNFYSNLSDGINLSGNNVSVTLIPILPNAIATANFSVQQSTAKSQAERIDEKTVSYTYDAKTSIEYSLTYTGFKEDIVVKEYTGQTEYSFRLSTNGLSLHEKGGSYYLMNSSNEIKATIGDIIIFTADERNNSFGTITSETIVKNQEYLLTIHVDAEYLADEKTTYPIRIDPTIEVSYEQDGTGAIQDVTINSLAGSSGSSTSLLIGKRETYGISRVLMKFPGLDLSSVASSADISSAAVEIRDILCESEEMQVYCYAFTGNSWTESTANWSTVSPNSYTSAQSNHAISYANGKQQTSNHRYSFDITKAVKGWKAGNLSQSKGIIFKASSAVENGSTYIHKTFASYNRTSNKPSLTVTYANSNSLITDDNYYLNNKYSGNYLRYFDSAAMGKSGLLAGLGTSIQWEFRKVDDGYVIRAVDDPTKYLGVDDAAPSETIEIVTISDSYIPERCKWNIMVAATGGCLIRNVHTSYYLYTNGGTLYTSSTTGSVGTTQYNSRVWRLVSTSEYGYSSNYAKRELSSSTSFANIEMKPNSTVGLTLNKYNSNELWADFSDFTFSCDGNGLANYSNGKMTSTKDSGGVKVTATHKVTGRAKNFYVLVGFSSTISATPLNDSIIQGLNQPHNVWPAGEESRYYTSTDLVRLDSLLTIRDSAYTTALGGSFANYINASNMLTHFLDNTGTLYTVDMKNMISNWNKAQEYRTRDLNFLISAVEATATYSNKTIKTINAFSCMVSESSDWGRAIGSYSTSISCVYKKTSSTTYTATITYELHDVYDWDRTITNMGNLPVSPQDMWELHHGGLAKNYKVYGCNTMTLNWTQGQTFGNGVMVSNET